VDLTVLGKERRFSPEAELMLFRIVQESLNNVRKHSRAVEARVVVEFAEDKTRVTISDNGRGFEQPGRLDDFIRSGKLGLAGMQERAQLLCAAFEVRSAPGKGTTITVEIPSQATLNSSHLMG